MAQEIQDIYTPVISKITLPNGGQTYYLKDRYARERLEALSSALYFAGVTTTTLYEGNTNPIVEIGGNQITAENGCVVIYNDSNAGSKEFVWTESDPGDPTTGKWMEFGDLSTLGKLAYQDVVVLNKGNGKNVLGASAEFQIDVPIYSVNNTNIKATASGTEISGDASMNAVINLGTPATDTFVKSVNAVTGKKLVTTTIKGVSGTENVLQQVTATKSRLGIQNISQVTGNTDITVQNVSNVGTASTWSFSMGNGTESETLIISGGNSTTPTLAAAQTASKITNLDVQVATGNIVNDGNGAEVATDIEKTYKTVATANANDTVVATGNTDASGTGDSIVSDVQVGDSATAITGITPQTAVFLQSVKVTQQPTINLSTGAASGTGVIEVTTGISSAANLQNVAVINQDVTKVALYADLDVSVAKN